MAHASQEAVKVARKFVKREAAKSPMACIDYGSYSYTLRRRQCANKRSRVVSDGTTIFSYGWWPIAYFDGDGLFITTDRYQTGEWPVSGRPKFSPTTDGHIAAVVEAAHMAGFRPAIGVSKSVTVGADGRSGDERNYRLYRRGA